MNNRYATADAASDHVLLPSEADNSDSAGKCMDELDYAAYGAKI